MSVKNEGLELWSFLWQMMGLKDSDVMMVWYAAIDESGTDEEQVYAVVSAVLGPGKSWPTVYKEWQAVLDSFHVEYFHGTEFNSRVGVAQHLSEAERNSCVAQLISKISSVDLEYITYGVDKALFRAVVSDYSGCNLSVYDYLLSSTLGDLSIRLSATASQVQDQVQGVVVIEQGCPLDVTLSNNLTGGRYRWLLRPIRNIHFEEKQHIPCQVADMIAYDSWKTIGAGNMDYQTRVLNVPHMRRSFEKITGGNPFRLMMIDEDWLRTDIPAVLRFLDSINPTT